MSNRKKFPVVLLALVLLSSCVTNVSAGRPAEVDAQTVTKAFLTISVPEYCASTIITPGPFEETSRIESCRADLQFDDDDGLKLVLEDRAGLHYVNLEGNQANEWHDINTPSIVEHYKRRYLEQAYHSSSYSQLPSERMDLMTRGPSDRYVYRQAGYSSYPPPDDEQSWFGPIAITDDGMLTAWLKPTFNDLDKTVAWQANLIDFINEGRTRYYPTKHTVAVFHGDEMIASSEVELDKQRSPIQASFSLDDKLLFIEKVLRQGDRHTSVYRWDIGVGEPQVVPCAKVGGPNRYSATENCEWAASETGCSTCAVPNWTIEKIRTSPSGRLAIIESKEERRRIRIFDMNENKNLMMLNLESTHFNLLRGTDIALSSQGSMVAYSSSDGSVYLFRVE